MHVGYLDINLLLWWMGCANVQFCRFFHVVKGGSKDRGSIPPWNNFINTTILTCRQFFMFFAMCQPHLHQQLRKWGPHIGSTSPISVHIHAPQQLCIAAYVCVVGPFVAFAIYNVIPHHQLDPPQFHSKCLKLWPQGGPRANKYTQFISNKIIALIVDTPFKGERKLWCTSVPFIHPTRKP